MPFEPRQFDALFAKSDDPWRYRTRWYEARKRSLTLACLPDLRYAAGFEPGCANGELSTLLAQRCDRFLACDGSARAASLARERLAPHRHAQVLHAAVPDEWPDEAFDLIVISELGYFLTEEALDLLAQHMLRSLRPGGIVLACHWRWPIDGGRLDGDGVHRRLNGRLALPRLTHVFERDFRIDVWSTDSTSVAQRDGIV